MGLCGPTERDTEHSSIRLPAFLSLAIVAFLLASVFPLSLAPQDFTQKKRVAVLNFDNPSANPSASFGADPGAVGKGVSAQLIQKLLQSGHYIVIDRSALEKLLQEQSESSAASADANAYVTASRIGQLLGLDAMIIGAVTRYGPNDNRPTGGGFSLHGGMHTRKSKAYVEITARILNISAAEIAGEFHATGESTRTGEVTTINAKGQSPSPELLSGDFADTLLGDATNHAVEQLAAQLNAFAEKIPQLQIAYEGLVAEVTGNTLLLNIGKKSGVKLGDKIHIYREKMVSPSQSPVEARPIREIIAIATITQVEDDSASATFSTASPSPQVGDHVASSSPSSH